MIHNTVISEKLYGEKMIPKALNYDELGYQSCCHSVVDEQVRRLIAGEGRLIIPEQTLKNKRLTSGMAVHIEHEIFLQTHGTTKFILPNQEIKVESGDVCIIPRHIPHREEVYADPEGNFCNLVILPTDKNQIIIHFGVMSQRGHYPIIGSERNYFSYDSGEWGPDFLEKIIPESSSAIVRSGTTIFLSWLAELLKGAKSEQDYSHEPLIVRCREYIDHDLHNLQLSVPLLAEVCNCSPNHLSTVFHKSCGIKLVDYINSLRILKAKQLLEQTTLLISEVAYACGFRDTTYFSKLFKNKSGYTPRSYRQMHP